MSITVRPASVIYRDCSRMNILVSSSGEIFVIYSQSSIAAELFSHQNGQLKSIATIRNEQRENLQGSTNFVRSGPEIAQRDSDRELRKSSNWISRFEIGLH